jgi:hypothetical protein
MQPVIAQGHREIASGAFFRGIGGREVNCEALAMGKLKTAVAQRGLDAFAAFFHGVVWQADNVEVAHARGASIDFHFDQVSVDAIDGSAERLEEHREGGRDRLRG